MLLLLLTLALLGSPACGTGQLNGFQVGTFFQDFDLNGEKVTGFRVVTGPLGKILSIQGKFGTSWGAKHGFSSGQPWELELWDGEYFTEVHGSYIAKMWSLIFCTSCDRCFSFGKEAGQHFSDSPQKPSQVLAGFFGYFGLAGFSGLGFKWADLPENATLLCS